MDELLLNLWWVPRQPDRIGNLAIRRGSENVLAYGDGIRLQVQVLDPASYGSADDLVAGARKTDKPGSVVLVAGSIPVRWRAELRRAALSFIDFSGAADIFWPRLRASGGRFGQPVERRSQSVPMQQGYARVVQELLIVSAGGVWPTLADLAEGSRSNLATTSRAISQLAEHGLVAKHRRGHRVAVEVTDETAVAAQLAARSAWPGRDRMSGYLWGRNMWDIAAKVAANAQAAGVNVAITGRAGAVFRGLLGTSSPQVVRCWVDCGDRPVKVMAGALGLEPAPADESNVALSADRWHVGTHRSELVTSLDWTTTVAHPIRVWCDLDGEIRGADFQEQFWGAIHRGT
jgi:hypothetical protein